MALITVDAVVDVSRHIVVLEVVRVIAAMAAGALEHRVVVRVDMAGRAHIVGIAVIGRELRVLGVIERGAGPGRRVVAVLARGREELRLRRMAGVRRVVVVRLVAADAGRRKRGVVVVDVAVAALPWWHSVQARQWKCRVVVIERGVGPDSRVMTDFAGGREPRCCMGWIIRAGVIFLVTRIAQDAVQSIVVVDVAIAAKARWDGVVTRQLKTGGRVVEFAVGPEHGVVAGFARGWESGRDVVYRGGRAVVILLVARNASRHREVVVVVDVTIDTGTRRHHVIPGQREARAVVVEGRIQPGRSAVA